MSSGGSKKGGIRLMCVKWSFPFLTHYNDDRTAFNNSLQVLIDQ